jgi:hypothetical protein
MEQLMRRWSDEGDDKRDEWTLERGVVGLRTGGLHYENEWRHA